MHAAPRRITKRVGFESLAKHRVCCLMRPSRSVMFDFMGRCSPWLLAAESAAPTGLLLVCDAVQCVEIAISTRQRQATSLAGGAGDDSRPPLLFLNKIPHPFV